MAATQSTLNDFFKSKRNPRDVSSKKASTIRNKLLVNDDGTLDILDKGVDTQKEIQELTCVPVVSVVNLQKSGVSKSVRKVRKATRSKLPSVADQSENIVTAFQRVASKKSIVLSDENVKVGIVSELSDNSDSSHKRCRDGSVSDDSSDTTDASASALPGVQCQHNVTPVKDQACTPQQQRKRRKAAPEDDDVSTPEPSRGGGGGVGGQTRGSARKNLNLGSDVVATKENAMAKPAAAPLQLSRCNKLSDLRAQLLKVTQCESKLEQFRATVRQAQTEAAAAAELVARHKGALASPRKAGSPLKTASPRKVLATHKSSPYKIPQSPLKFLQSPHKALQSPRKVQQSPRQRPPHPNLELFKSINMEVPVSPRKTPVSSPCKAPNPVPAYQRYQHLVQDDVAVSAHGATVATTRPELALPNKYRVLRELFRAVDTVVSLMHNRREVVTYTKLRAAVQQMIRRTFCEINLGQLARVFPFAYLFRQDKIRPGNCAIAASAAAGTPNKSGYQLTIAANMEYKQQHESSLTATAAPPNTRVNLLSKFDGPSTASTEATTPTRAVMKSEGTYRKMDSVVLVERRFMFHEALIRTLHKHHAEFLKSLEPSVVVADQSSIQRWHPSFPLEEVADVAPAALPQPPHTQTLSNATDVLAAARGLLSMNPRMEAAVERAAANTTAAALPLAVAGQDMVRPPPAADQKAKVQQAVQNRDVAMALKGISVSLLEKIRAREAASLSRTMVRSSAATHRLEQLSRLPGMARILRHTLVAEKKAALHWEAALATLRASHTGMLGIGELEEHLELLLQQLPTWITKHKLSSGVFVKINKSTDINSIVDKLQAIIKQNT